MIENGERGRARYRQTSEVSIVVSVTVVDRFRAPSKARQGQTQARANGADHLKLIPEVGPEFLITSGERSLAVPTQREELGGSGIRAFRVRFHIDKFEQLSEFEAWSR
jgi:hypothetical protein